MSTSLITSHPHSLNSSHKALQGFSIKQTKQSTKNNQFVLKTFVVFTSCKVRLSLEVPCLNTPVLFPFGGETHKTNFPPFVDIFARRMCCFFIDFRRNRLDNLFLEWTSPQLQNDIRLELATLLEPNHKMKDKPQTLFCFVRQTPNQNEADWTHRLFKMLKSNLRQDRFARK